MPTHAHLAAPNPERSSPSPSPLRLELKPAAPTAVWIDGVWWPRSTDLIVELPMLLTAVAARIGTVVLVGYHLNFWQPAPARMDHAAGSVALQGFTSDAPPSIVVVGTGGLRLTLTVLTPHTTSTAAEDAFNSVSQTPDDAADETDPRLQAVGKRLAAVDGSRGEERAADIAQWVNDAAEQFADAPVQAFVPILVEHIVRQKLGPRRHVRIKLDDSE